MKIFVTVGTSNFNRLFQKMDQLAAANKELEVIGQIGLGDFKPVYFKKVIRFSKNIAKYYKWAEVVVSHGGAGTVYDILSNGKKAIVVPNESLVEEHQIELVDRFHKEGFIIKGNLDSLNDLIKQLPSYHFNKYREKPNRISKLIENFMRKIVPNELYK